MHQFIACQMGNKIWTLHWGFYLIIYDHWLHDQNKYNWLLIVQIQPIPINNTGFTLSVCPSFGLSGLWTKSCLLCIFHNTHQIRFIFYTSYQLTLENGAEFDINSKIFNFGNFFYFRLLDPIYDLCLSPMMTLTYDHTHNLDLGFSVFFTKREHQWLFIFSLI